MIATVQPRRAASPEEEAFVALVRTADLLSRAMPAILKPEDVSLTQYNILRILRGAPEGLTCSEAGSRMISRDPDITRLLDRLEKRGLIERRRQSEDRRVVVTQITPEGLALLARLDEPVRTAHRRQLGHLGRERLAALTQLLNECQREVPPE